MVFSIFLIQLHLQANSSRIRIAQENSDFCIATGKPFLGYKTHQGRVVYLDLENGPQDVVSSDETASGMDESLAAKNLGVFQ